MHIIFTKYNVIKKTATTSLVVSRKIKANGSENRIQKQNQAV